MYWYHTQLRTHLWGYGTVKALELENVVNGKHNQQQDLDGKSGKIAFSNIVQELDDYKVDTHEKLESRQAASDKNG